MNVAQVRHGDVLNRKYRVDRMVGEGGMGFVVAALHIGLDEMVALKFLHPECSTDELLVARFKREAQNATKIKSDHVVRIMDVDALPTGVPFMVMEYLEGEDLAARLSAKRVFPVGVAVDHVLEACEAVRQAHHLGIIHRDLKPSNLFLARVADGTTCLKVLDFGISKATNRTLEESFRLTKKQEIFGSPMYMSPEQLQSAADVDTRGDIWSLGVILYELLGGSPPFQANTLALLCARILDGPTPLIGRIRPDVPPELDAAIQRCLQRDRDDRWPRVEEFAAAIAPFAARTTQTSLLASLRNPPPESRPFDETQLSVSSRTAIPSDPGPVGEPPTRSRRFPLAAAAAATVLLGLLAAGAVAFCSLGGDPAIAAATQQDTSPPVPVASTLSSTASAAAASNAAADLDSPVASAPPAPPRPAPAASGSPPKPSNSARPPAPPASARNRDRGLDLFVDSQ